MTDKTELFLIDQHVGKKLRARRQVMGISQEWLGDSVGITFQQIQKQERGINRISSGTLWAFSRLLGVNINYFFDGLGEPFAEVDDVYNKEILTYVKEIKKLDPDVRKRVLSLIKAITESVN